MTPPVTNTVRAKTNLDTPRDTFLRYSGKKILSRVRVDSSQIHAYLGVIPLFSFQRANWFVFRLWIRLFPTTPKASRDTHLRSYQVWPGAPILLLSSLKFKNGNISCSATYIYQTNTCFQFFFTQYSISRS